MSGKAGVTPRKEGKAPVVDGKAPVCSVAGEGGGKKGAGGFPLWEAMKMLQAQSVCMAGKVNRGSGESGCWGFK